MFFYSAKCIQHFRLDAERLTIQSKGGPVHIRCLLRHSVSESSDAPVLSDSLVVFCFLVSVVAWGLSGKCDRIPARILLQVHGS